MTRLVDRELELWSQFYKTFFLSLADASAKIS
jgi:hypothetical protein